MGPSLSLTKWFRSNLFAFVVRPQNYIIQVPKGEMPPRKLQQILVELRTLWYLLQAAKNGLHQVQYSKQIPFFEKMKL